MNMKLILLALIGAVSTNCLAAEIKHGKVLEHKEWTTGNAVGRLSNHPIKNNLPKRFSDSSYGLVFSSLTHAEGIARKETAFTGTSTIAFSNDTSSDKSFYYHSSICAVTADHTEHCLHIFETITLEPNGSYREYISPELRFSFDKPGSYPISLSTDFGDFENTNHYSRSDNTIDIA